jgi:hypothetical protein
VPVAAMLIKVTVAVAAASRMGVLRFMRASSDLAMKIQFHRIGKFPIRDGRYYAGIVAVKTR